MALPNLSKVILTRTRPHPTFAHFPGFLLPGIGKRQKHSSTPKNVILLGCSEEHDKMVAQVVKNMWDVIKSKFFFGSQHLQTRDSRA